MKIGTRELVMTGLLIALAAVLAQFPINGSIGLDAMPAFFGAVAVSPLLGGFVGAIAHLLIASFSGFVFGLPLHIVVALTMFFSCYIYGYVRRKGNRYLAMVIGIIMNGPISLAISALAASIFGMGFSGMPMFLALIVPLTVAASINVIVADVLYGVVGSQIRNSLKV